MRASSASCGCPKTRASPSVTRIRLQTAEMSVVLPAPFGPEQPEELARADAQVDLVEREEAVVVALGQPASSRAAGSGTPRTYSRIRFIARRLRSVEARSGRVRHVTRVAVIDPQPAVRAGLALLLRHEPGLVPVGSAPGVDGRAGADRAASGRTCSCSSTTCATATASASAGASRRRATGPRGRRLHLAARRRDRAAGPRGRRRRARRQGRAAAASSSRRSGSSPAARARCRRCAARSSSRRAPRRPRRPGAARHARRPDVAGRRRRDAAHVERPRRPPDGAPARAPAPRARRGTRSRDRRRGPQPPSARAVVEDHALSRPLPGDAVAAFVAGAERGRRRARRHPRTCYSSAPCRWSPWSSSARRGVSASSTSTRAC